MSLHVHDLPDSLPVVDPHQGFTPPFAVDQDDYGMQTVGVFQTVPEAARKASKLKRQTPWARVEITDQRRKWL